MSYKAYQQVLNLSTPKAATPVTKSETPTKRRTKSGCLTCRKRKKKCDEDVVDGKCQGCTRNFLECCWPEKPVSAAISTTPSPKIEFKTPKAPKTPLIQAAYPSPEMSPVFEGKIEHNEISKLELSKSHYKVTKPKKQTKPSTSPKTTFVITSFDKRNALVHVK
ncbi:hypothetical protein CAAN1_07S06370 [[Candida] anglica]|uniref:Zn(2)-C6 fungal-type domain-containing protein n=1 Tax=[Candida] anglica TaxID=148631 RepID=A0ABP0EBR4_9ASCO